MKKISLILVVVMLLAMAAACAEAFVGSPVTPSPIVPVDPVGPVGPVGPVNPSPVTPSPVTPDDPVNPSPVTPSPDVDNPEIWNVCLVKVAAKYADGDEFHMNVLLKDKNDIKMISDIIMLDSIGIGGTEYFGDEAKEIAIANNLVPAGVDMIDYKLAEFEHFDKIDFISGKGDVEALFTFITEYSNDTNLLVFVGYETEYGMKWIPQVAEVVEGQIDVVLTEEVLTEMNGKEIKIAFLAAF